MLVLGHERFEKVDTKTAVLRHYGIVLHAALAVETKKIKVNTVSNLKFRPFATRAHASCPQIFLLCFQNTS